MIENCTLQDEYCTSSVANLKMDLDIAICQKSKVIVCDNNTDVTDQHFTRNTTRTTHKQEIICQSDSVVTCSQKPKLVTVSVKKQPCGNRTRITKICITDNERANYTCKDLVLAHSNGGGVTCDETNITKEIITEALPDRHSALKYANKEFYREAALFASKA